MTPAVRKGYLLSAAALILGCGGMPPAERTDPVNSAPPENRPTDLHSNWRHFREQMERPPPSALGTAIWINRFAEPNGGYLAQMHRQIHAEFADRFQARLPTDPESGYSDPYLTSVLEIVLNRDGSIHEIAFFALSGLPPFDFGAFYSVSRAAPFPPVPVNMVSYEGRAYFRWGFHRNARQCGLHYAAPFLLVP